MIEELHKYIQNRINDNDTTKPDFHLKSDLDRFIYSSSKRLINTFELMKDGNASKFDFECCLKNYLGLVKKEICLDYHLSEKAIDLGLSQDGKGIIKLDLKYPEYTSRDLIRQAQLVNYDAVEDEDVTDGSLVTNPFIRNLTGYSYFKSAEQKLCVGGALRTPSGYSTLVSMSTGGGKSLITQTVTYQTSGLTIVVVPTISLMINQFDGAVKTIKHDTTEEIFYYHSGKSLSDFYTAVNKGTAKLLFVSPESIIKNQKLKEFLLIKNREGYLKNLIIDEAHIILEWGSSFRVDFQCLDAWRKELISANENLRTFLLSATFDRNTVEYLRKYYSDNDKWIEIRCDKLRKEIRYNVIKAKSYDDKKQKMIDCIKLLPHPMIVYVRSPGDADYVSSILDSEGFKNFRKFTGNTSNTERDAIISDWLENKFEIMIATCAFGVGVDKKDIRTVLHTYIPDNPGKYYQEAGRGGRDGMPSLSVVLYTMEDIDSAFGMATKVLTPEKISGRWFSMLRSPNTIRMGNSRYVLDTYIKPNYNESEEFIDFANDRDIAWNVYVILLLRRNSLISIDSVDYINGKYVFNILINDKTILEENSDSYDLFLMVRNLEWDVTEKEFIKMRNNLKNVGKKCWCGMFNDTYTLTDERCYGCDYPHVAIDEDIKVLKKPISRPLMKKSVTLEEEFRYSNIALVICNDNKNSIISNLISKSVCLLVSDNVNLKKYAGFETGNAYLIYMNYEEFFMYVEKNCYYVSGSIIIDMPKDGSVISRLVSCITSRNNENSNYIIVSDEDYYIDYRRKNLSELIDGTCKQY